MPVFFIHSQDVADGIITITDPLLSHIAKSLRTKLGDTLLFNNEQGYRYQTTVKEITKKNLQAKIQQIYPPPYPTSPPLILAQASLKGEKMGWVVQKATELGISKIIPLVTDRVIRKFSRNQGGAHYDRWTRIAMEAAQQSERWTVPIITPTQSFQKLLKSPQRGSILFLAERENGLSLLAIPDLTENQHREITLVIGPEGGWSAEEIEAAKSHKWVFVSLGKEILRSETASLAAIAILQARIRNSIKSSI